MDDGSGSNLPVRQVFFSSNSKIFHHPGYRFGLEDLVGLESEALQMDSWVKLLVVFGVEPLEVGSGLNSLKVGLINEL